MVIGVDMDEVLCETIEAVLKHQGNNINGHIVTKDDISNYHWREITKYGLTLQQSIDYFDAVLATDHHLILRPVSGALDILKQLKYDGHTLIVITARRDLLRTNTVAWLSTYYPDIFDNIYFASHFTQDHREKSDICRELGIQIMIEDNPHYATELAQGGITTILLEKPRNKHNMITSPLIHLVPSRTEASHVLSILI